MYAKYAKYAILCKFKHIQYILSNETYCECFKHGVAQVCHERQLERYSCPSLEESEVVNPMKIMVVQNARYHISKYVKTAK
jgi:hypothetical protein